MNNESNEHIIINRIKGILNHCYQIKGINMGDEETLLKVPHL